LLRAFALLRARRTDTHLVLAGDGSERAMLDALAAELKLGTDAVTFLGFREDVPRVLSALDGYVLPSREEGLGTAILEALAVGLPVVATRVGGIPESVIHEKTGLLVEPDQPQELADAMLRFMESEELRRTLPEGARHHIETNFTESALVHKTLSFYESVLKTCGSDRK
jgi:glycosyltransferase involved in cell wall biosynthesis